MAAERPLGPLSPLGPLGPLGPLARLQAIEDHVRQLAKEEGEKVRDTASLRDDARWRSWG